MGLPESAKAIGRQNIDAQKSITYSYQDSQITAIDGSAVGNPAALTGINHDYNLSGLGTTLSLLGLADPIRFSASGTAADSLVSSVNVGNKGFSASVPSAWTAEFTYNRGKFGYEWPSAEDTANHEGLTSHTLLVPGNINLSSHDCSYITHNYVDLDVNNGLRMFQGYGSGSNQSGIFASVSGYSNGPTIHFQQGTANEYVDIPSIRRWNGYSAGVSAGNCISGNGTSGSPLGLSATAQWTAGGNWYPMTEISAGYLKISAQAFAGAQIYQNESSLSNWSPTGVLVRHTAQSVGGGYADNLYGEVISLTYNAGEYWLRQISSDASGLRTQYNGRPDNLAIYGFGSAAFSDDRGSNWEFVDPAAIRNWNNKLYKSAIECDANSAVTAIGGSAIGGDSWKESGNPLSTGFGGNQVTAASQYNEGAGNWAARTVKMSGLPDQTLYGFQSRPPAGTGSYLINAAGAFVAPSSPNINLKVYKPTTAPVYLSTSDYPVMSNTADGLYVIVNLGSGPYVTYADGIGATATISQNNSAQLIWDSDAQKWVRWNN